MLPEHVTNQRSFWQKLRSLSLSSQILIGLICGIAIGLFFGELVAPISILADGYILLLQMTVLPYITVSLIAGIGSLTPHQAALVFSRVGLLLLMLWCVSLSLVFVMPLAFPNWKTASFYSTSLIEPRQSFDFLNLYIPANPFNALANNIVPAVVLFSIVLGVALIRLENKQPLITGLEILTRALAKVSGFVVRLTPIGLFAIGANLAGTLRIEELARVQVYLIVFSLISSLLCVWILPGLVSALTPITYREVLKLTRDALITAFMTGNLFVVLPILSDASKKVLTGQTSETETVNMPHVIVPASFNFPHSGKILSISFILFAAWFADIAFSFIDHVKLAVLGVLSYFGSLNVAVPYLLDLFRIPIDTFQLFLATGLVNSRFGSATAAMHTFVLAVLGSCATAGLITINARKLFRFVLISVGLTAMIIGGSRFYFAHGIVHTYTKGDLLKSMDLIRKQVPTIVNHTFTPYNETTTLPPLERISKRGRLRVGYFEDSLPYTYLNSSGKLVGLDVDMANQLAIDMGVGLEFVPIDRSKIFEQWNQAGCDILMSGIAITTDRAKYLLLTNSYVDEHMAFLTFDFRRNDFLSRDEIGQHPGLRIGVPNVPYYIAKLRDYAPNAKIVVLNSLDEELAGSLHHVDAIAITAERGSAWTLLHPQYSVVVPQPDVMTIPVAYAVGNDEAELRSFLNAWLELKKKDGTISQVYDHWILGKNAERTNARWSIIRNVLHWVR